jgi:hypothetical protein
VVFADLQSNPPNCIVLDLKSTLPDNKNFIIFSVSKEIIVVKDIKT